MMISSYETITPRAKNFKKETAKLENVEESLSRRLKELSAINALTRRVTANLSLDLIVQSTYEHIDSAVSPDAVLVYLVQGDKLVLQKLNRKNSSFGQPECKILDMGQCLCGLVLSNGDAAFSKDINNDYRCTLDYCKEIGITSFAAVPLRVKDDILGVLGVASLTPRDFSRQADFLETLASQISIALHNASLHEQVQQYAARLEIENRNLEEANIALKVLLKQRETDKIELEERIVSNVKELVEPIFEKLYSSKLNENQRAYIEILETHLKDIVSPFVRRLSSQYLNFTPTEIQVAGFIKQGKTTKEIANLLNLSDRTVSFHRENIRSKLGLKNQKANLRSHLLYLV